MLFRSPPLFIGELSRSDWGVHLTFPFSLFTFPFSPSPPRSTVSRLVSPDSQSPSSYGLFANTFSDTLKSPQKLIPRSFLPENQCSCLNYAEWHYWHFWHFHQCQNANNATSATCRFYILCAVSAVIAVFKTAKTAITAFFFLFPHKQDNPHNRMK